MPRDEADTRALLIERKLQAAGWSSTQVTREHYYRRDQPYTAGRIYLRGDRARRGEPLALPLRAARIASKTSHYSSRVGSIDGTRSGGQ
jgi:hypothetical protein